MTTPIPSVGIIITCKAPQSQGIHFSSMAQRLPSAKNARQRLIIALSGSGVARQLSCYIFLSKQIITKSLQHSRGPLLELLGFITNKAQSVSPLMEGVLFPIPVSFKNADNLRGWLSSKKKLHGENKVTAVNRQSPLPTKI